MQTIPYDLYKVLLISVFFPQEIHFSEKRKRRKGATETGADCPDCTEREDDWGSPDLCAKSGELLLPSAYGCKTDEESRSSLGHFCRNKL